MLFTKRKKAMKKKGVWVACEGPVIQLRWTELGPGWSTPVQNSTSAGEVVSLFTDCSPLPVAQYAGTEMARLAREKASFPRTAKLVTQESKSASCLPADGLKVFVG